MNLLDELQFPKVRHYYGDSVRALFVTTAVLIVLFSPLYTVDLRTQAPFVVAGVLVLVALAAITNPNKTWTMICNVVASGLGLAIFGTWALSTYNTDDALAFVLRSAIALILLFAFYFSVKTVRAMMMGRVGRFDPVDDFHHDKEDDKDKQPEIESDT